MNQDKNHTSVRLSKVLIKKVEDNKIIPDETMNNAIDRLVNVSIEIKKEKKE